MDEKKVLDDVERKARSLPGVIDFRYMDDELRSMIFALESEAEENGALGGLMPFINTGVWDTLKRKHCFLLVVSSSIPLLESTRDVVYISDQKGQKVGEYLTEERREEMAGKKNISYLSDDFIFYTDIMPEGQPFFVLPPMPFPFLQDIEGIKDVISGSISTLSDDYVREVLGYSQSKHWTHLVGFNISSED